MTQGEILEELRKLPATERITIIEAALRLIQEDLQEAEQPFAKLDRKRQLTAAAEVLLPSYSTDEELTAFKALDHENFHA